MEREKNPYVGVIQKIYNGELPQFAVHFFSDSNMTTIQQQIINEISYYFNRKNLISRQNDYELFVIMKQVYNQVDKPEHKSDAQYVQEMNRDVVLRCIRIIIPNILQYMGYMKDMQDNYNTFYMSSDQQVNRNILEYSKSSN